MLASSCTFTYVFPFPLCVPLIQIQSLSELTMASVLCIPSLPLCLMQVLSDAPHKEAYSYSGVAIYCHCASLTHTHTLSLS